MPQLLSPRSHEDVEDLRGEVINAQNNGSKFPGMSYEDGVLATIDWFTNSYADNPMSDD